MEYVQNLLKRRKAAAELELKNLTGVSKVYVELREKRHQEISQIGDALLVLSGVVGRSEQLFCYHEGKYTLKSDGNCCKCHLPSDPKAK